MAERTTIKELARRSGVSVGTVSRALNGYADVAEDTRRRVIALAEELDYTPLAAARTLATRRSDVIGVFLETGAGHPDLLHPFFHEVLVGLRDTLGRRGYDLLLFARSDDAGSGFGGHAFLRRCRQHRVDGVVLMGVNGDDPEVRRLARSELPCVGVDLELPGHRTAYIASDNIDGGRQAVAHLHELGHRRIATIAGPLDSRPGRERLRGYREGVTDAGLAYRDELVAYGDWYVDSGEAATNRLLATPEPPTAIFAASDMMAVGAYRAARAAGLEIPGDLSVIGFDDVALAAHLHPPLTTIRQDKTGLGAAAALALLAEIGTLEPSPRSPGAQPKGSQPDGSQPAGPQPAGSPALSVMPVDKSRGDDGTRGDDGDRAGQGQPPSLPVQLIERGSTAPPRHHRAVISGMTAPEKDER